MAGLRAALLVTGGLAASAIRLSRREIHFPHYDIDLDLPPRQRWKHIARESKEAVRLKIDKLTGEWKNHDEDQLEELKNSIDVSDELREEMEGILEELDHPRLTYRDVLFWQMRYELGLTHGFECTAVLMALPNGTMLHGRNLDVGGRNASDMLEKRMQDVDLTFLKGGKPLFRSIGSRGMVGVHNAVRKGGWTLEQNTRHNASIKTRREWMDSVIREAKRGAPIATLAFRQAMEYEPTYAGALTRLRSTLFMTDTYVIMSGAGPYEGAVITVRAASEAMPPWYPVRTLEQGDWFLVQSNDDGGKLTKDRRPLTAMSVMKQAGQSSGLVDLQTRGATAMERAMRGWPVCNEATQFTWYMSAVAAMDYVIADDCVRPNVTVEKGFSIPGQ